MVMDGSIDPLLHPYKHRIPRVEANRAAVAAGHRPAFALLLWLAAGHTLAQTVTTRTYSYNATVLPPEWSSRWTISRRLPPT
jgi:hypothetical protein